MNCQQVDKYILRYCDNNLSPELTAELEQHLLNCPDCSKGIKLTRLENSILSEIPLMMPINDDFNLKIMQKINANVLPNKATSNKFGVNKTWFWVLPVAAVLLLFLTTSFPQVNNFKLGNQLSSSDNSSPKIISESTPLKISLNDDSNNIPVNESAKQKAMMNSPGIAPLNEVDNEEIRNYSAPENMETSSYDREMMKLENPNRADLLMRKADINKAKINISPQNIPVNFTLLDINNSGTNEITYYYIDASKQTTFDITIRETDSENTAITSMDDVELSNDDLLGMPAKSFMDNSFNTWHTYMEIDGIEYTIIINSNLSPEDITNTASSLTFTN